MIFHWYMSYHCYECNRLVLLILNVISHLTTNKMKQGEKPKKLEKLLDFLSCVLVAVSEICIHLFNWLKCWLIINKRNERKLLYLECKWMRMYFISAREACLRYQCILQNENNTKYNLSNLFQKIIHLSVYRLTYNIYKKW